MVSDTTSAITSNESTRFVTLVSQEGFKFILPHAAAIGAGTINNMLGSGDDAGFQESRTGIVHLPEARAVILEKVCEYLLYKYHYNTLARSGGKDINLPDFIGRIPPEIALELLTITDYLEA